MVLTVIKKIWINLESISSICDNDPMLGITYHNIYCVEKFWAPKKVLSTAVANGAKYIWLDKEYLGFGEYG